MEQQLVGKQLINVACSASLASCLPCAIALDNKDKARMGVKHHEVESWAMIKRHSLNLKLHATPDLAS